MRGRRGKQSCASAALRGSTRRAPTGPAQVPLDATSATASKVMQTVMPPRELFDLLR